MRIHEQNEVLKEQVKILLKGYRELKTYLESPKFQIDTNVNKNDVLTRIREIGSEYFNTPTIVEV